MSLKALFELSERLAKRADLEQIFDGWLLTKYSKGAMTKARQEECRRLLDAKKLIVQTNVNRRLLLDNLLMGLKYDV
jgi:hypothetical protein